MNLLQDNCVHVWAIPELPVDVGVWLGTCRKCGAKRNFKPADFDPRAVRWRDGQRPEGIPIS